MDGRVAADGPRQPHETLLPIPCQPPLGRPDRHPSMAGRPCQRHVRFKMRLEHGKALHSHLALRFGECNARWYPFVVRHDGLFCLDAPPVNGWRCNNQCLCTIASAGAKNTRKSQKSVAKLWCRRYGTEPPPLGGFCTMKSGYKIGYVRVSTDAQETHLQLDALQRAKCSRIYQEKASGAKADRPELMRLLD